MVSPTTLYVITSWIWDDDYDKEGLHEPEIYSTKSAANMAARELMNRYADLLNPFGDPDEYDFCHNLDDEGLYRGKLSHSETVGGLEASSELTEIGTLEGGPGGHVAVEMCVYKVGLNQPSARKTAKRPAERSR